MTTKEIGADWSVLLHPTVRRFEVAAAVGGSAVWNAEGSKALATLLRDMARKLDIAAAYAENRYAQGMEAGRREALRALGSGGIAVSARMVEAAQASYRHNPEYGLTDHDMKWAVHAALKELGKPRKTKRNAA